MEKCSNCAKEITDKDEKVCGECGHYHELVSNNELVDERCECGNLLAKLRVNDEGKCHTVEIKCRRCKRIHVIAVERLIG